jgi:hypothetical protein
MQTETLFGHFISWSFKTELKELRCSSALCPAMLQSTEIAILLESISFIASPPRIFNPSTLQRFSRQ